MAARGKGVEAGRKGGAPSSSSDALSSPARKAKSDPRPSLSNVAGSSPDRGATTGKAVPHYLRPTISSYHGRAATDTQVPAKATRQPARPKSPSPSPSLSPSPALSPSSSKSTSTRRKSYSTSTSPKEGSGKASNVPFSKTAVFSRSASTKITKPQERGSSTAAATKSVATKKIKGSVPSDRSKAVSKGNKDAAPTSGGVDRIEEKTMIIQEPQGTHIGKDLKNSVASDSRHVSSDQPTQTAAAATVNSATDNSNDPTDLKKAALSKEKQAGTEIFPAKKPASNTDLEAEDSQVEESPDNGKILDVVQTKEGFDADASAVIDDDNSDDVNENAEEEEEETNEEQAEIEDGSCIDQTDSFDIRQSEAKETEDGERVAEPSMPNNGTPNAREGQELCRASVLSPTTEDNENKPRKLEFRRGNTLSPKVEDDANTPRKLEFRKGTVLPRKAEEDVNTPRKLEFMRGRAANKDNDEGGGQEKDGAVVYNQVIEETAIKLVGARRSKVRALVGAFETVISIHETDAQSSQSLAPAPIPVLAPSSSASGPASPARPLPPSGSTPKPASVPDPVSIPSPTSAPNVDEDPSAPRAQGQEEEEDKDGEEEDYDDEKEEEEEDKEAAAAASQHD